MKKPRLRKVESRICLVETEGEKLVSQVAELVKVTKELKEENVYLKNCFQGVKEENCALRSEIEKLKGKDFGNNVAIKDLREENSDLSKKCVNFDFQIHRMSHTLECVQEKMMEYAVEIAKLIQYQVL